MDEFNDAVRFLDFIIDSRHYSQNKAAAQSPHGLIALAIIFTGVWMTHHLEDAIEGLRGDIRSLS